MKRLARSWPSPRKAATVIAWQLPPPMSLCRWVTQTQSLWNQQVITHYSWNPRFHVDVDLPWYITILYQLFCASPRPCMNRGTLIRLLFREHSERQLNRSSGRRPQAGSQATRQRRTQEQQDRGSRRKTRRRARCTKLWGTLWTCWPGGCRTTLGH